MLKTILLAASVALACPALAQAPAAAPSSAPAASKAKKELVAKVLQLQRPGIEGAARVLAEQPAAQMMQRAALVIQSNLPADKREAVAKEIQADAKKYAAEAVPILAKRAVELAPTTIGPVLEANFSEAELVQLVGLLESPVNRKFQLLGVEMQRALSDKLVADSRGSIEPKLRALEQSMAQRLNVQPPAGAGSAGSAPAR
ncbi:hypothetical protein [Methylibium sp.]|uniref:hypothetical protein n=1 Tax=Methylibium sp. TaxID=2067992 RepID=UPI00182D148F|nr:hypothetical protein [Methylibium sp.]MBA3589768.1 hypothetical protein [Methylibium sp.]